MVFIVVESLPAPTTDIDDVKFVPLSDADSKNRLSAIPFKENPTILVGISIFCCND